MILQNALQNTKVRDSIVVLAAGLLLGLLGPFTLRLPFNPVPVSLVPQMVLFLAATLGAKRATAAVALYILQGVLGLPVFSSGGSTILHLLGPTGGYIIGYLASAFVVGTLSEKVKSRSGLFASMFLGSALVFAFGLPQLSLYIGWSKAFLFGCVPFLAGDLIKTTLAFLSAEKLALKRDR